MFSTILNDMLCQFPEHVETIKVLYHFDDEFRSLCEDYHTSQVNANKFKSKLAQNMITVSEYKDLSKTLEQEIIEYVKNRE